MFNSATYIRLVLASLLMLPAMALLANIPGGGTNGANVTLTDNGTTVTLANGIISIVVTKADASIHTINYTFKNSTNNAQTINVLGNGYSGGKFYWENSSDLGPLFSYAVVANPTNTGGNYAEIALTASDAGNVSNIVMEAHFSLLRGNSGFYVTPIWIHRSTDDAFSMGECRDNIYSGSIFNWMSVDATRNKLMPVSGGSAIGVDSGPKEVTLWTSGIYAGLYEDKYKYTADYSTLRAWGWSSVGSGGKNVGLWDVAGSAEYMASGPMRRELICHDGTTILNTPHGGHYGFCSDSTWAAGEVWAKVCGPHFIYCNNITNAITVTNTAAQTLYADALAQADAETSAWPYSWFTNSYYATGAQRGTVTGKIIIADTNNPNASASNLWVGVEVQPTTNSTITYDFQKWYKPYQFWTHTDANGNFTIPDVIATNGYTLYAFVPGAAGTFQSQNQVGGNPPNELDIPASPFSVTVTAGATNNLGTITWTPARVGPTVFEIGYPDRTAAKFRHGEDWWVGDIGPSATVPSPVWSKFLEFPLDFPGGPNYVVGQSRWTTDWNFIQPVVINNTGAYDPWGNNSGSSSTITFNLPSAPTNNGSLYIATASSYQGPMIVRVNNNNIAGVNGYDPDYDNSGSGSDASIREGIHGLFADTRLNVSSNYLHAGQNTIYINMRKGGYLANHSMYDYLRLELPGYVPPAPATARAYAGNNCNLICWPVQPGATSYNLLRSTTSGSGYVSITNGVTGPVCGSGWNNATFLDTTAANGTPYYYVVRSVNPVNSSTNSPEASATPNAGISASAPAAPTNLVAAGVAHQSVTLNWSAPSNANFYTVYRSTLFNNGGGASNVLGTIVLANNVTNATYMDISPTDGSIYSYAISATGTGGTSSNSVPAAVIPKPSPPATPPPSLFITSVISTNPAQDVTFTWNVVSGAVGYAIYRATSASGPFTFIQSVSTMTFFDGGLATNQIYYYRVAALNAAGVTANATDLINPKQAAPTNLVATATNAQITLAWSATPGATSYTVKRGAGVANETTTVVSGYSGTTYTNTGLANGTTYYYVVTAAGANGASGNSPEASATPLVAGNGIWISPASGNWGGATNWLGSNIAAGADNSADFSTLNLPTNLTVTLDSARTISDLLFGDPTTTYNWTLTGTNALTLGNTPTIEVLNQTATISTPLAGTNGLTKAGAGILTLGGVTNSYAGGTTLNEGIFNLDFSASGSPINALISTQALTFNGGSLTLTGSNSAANSQVFGAAALNNGHANIILTPGSGGAAAATLASLVRPSNDTTHGGSARFSTTGTTTINGTTSSTLLVDNQGNPYATYGLNDWAGTDPGGNVIAATFQETINASVTWGSTHTSAGPLKFDNSSGPIQLTLYGGSTYTIQGGYLMTTNSKGVTIQGGHNGTSGTSWIRPYKNAGASGSDVTVIQNSAQGDLIFGSLFNIPNGGTSGALYNLVKAGVGRLIAGQDEGYSKVFLNEGTLQVIRDGQLGTGAGSVEFYGGTLEAAASATFSTHQFNFNTAGGLSATAGNTATFGNLLAGAGSVTIGGIAGDTGAVVLTNANYYSGGTVLQGGTLNINGIYALGGANYGGLTFNGGTLQYAANFPGNNGAADLTSIGTAGITLAAGGGTMDLNGNAVTCAGAIGNNGTGALTVKGSLSGGTLTLQSGNNYSGNTTVTNATLIANNATGSATGSGDVLVQNAGVLSGSGAVAGSVTVATGGTLSVGNVSDSLAIGNNLTLNGGSATRLQIQHSPPANSSVSVGNTLAFGGTLIVTNLGGALTNGDSFPLFNAANYAGTFTNLTLPALATNLVWNTNLLSVNGTLSVAAALPPTIGQIAIAGTNLIIGGSGGTPGWNYYVLTATNLAAPNWTPVATNQFAGDGSFIFTNSISSGTPQTYFRLQLQ